MNIYFNYRRLFDILLALVAAAVVYMQPFPDHAVFQWPTRSEFNTLMLGVAASSASLLGFVLAANTFLISHTQHRRLSILRKSAGYKQLLDIMRSSLWRLLALVIYAGVGSLVVSRFVDVALTGLAFAVVLALMGLGTLIWSTMATLAIPLD